MYLEMSQSAEKVAIRTKIGEDSCTSHHGHGISSGGKVEELSALIQVIEGTIDFCKIVSNNVERTVDSTGAWDSVCRHLSSRHIEPPAESERSIARGHTFYLNVECSQILVR